LVTVKEFLSEKIDRSASGIEKAENLKTNRKIYSRSSGYSN